MIVTSLKKEYEKDLEAAVKAAIQKNNFVFKEAGGEEYYVEVYADYRDEFPKSAIKEIAEEYSVSKNKLYNMFKEE